MMFSTAAVRCRACSLFTFQPSPFALRSTASLSRINFSSSTSSSSPFTPSDPRYQAPNTNSNTFSNLKMNPSFSAIPDSSDSTSDYSALRLNAADVIIKDHNHFRQLYKQFKSTSSVDERQRLANEMIRSISIHDGIELTLLYDAMDKHMPDGKKQADHSREEHQALRQKLYELDGKSVTEEQFEPKLDAAFRDLEHHMQEEERDYLPRLKAAMGEKAFTDLGEKLERQRPLAPTHPHPSAPVSPWGATAAGMASAPVDRIRDIARDFPQNKA